MTEEIERLVSAALKRDGVVEARGFKSHWQLRAALGDAEPNKRNWDDEEGFLTSTGRFVDRDEAKIVGGLSGQCMPMAGRDLLSSDINWDYRPEAEPKRQPSHLYKRSRP